MIRIEPSQELAVKHAEAVINRLKKQGKEDAVLSEIQTLGLTDIKSFVLADIHLLFAWVRSCPEKLQFTQLKDIYSGFFSNGAKKYVDGDYNAYQFLWELGITVCPYCDDEYLDIVTIDDRQRRTSEVDHFFPKSKYPALAMCFYNLIPSGQNCNGLKLEQELGMSPYESQIEEKTYLYPDIPVGVLLDSISPTECKVRFHAQDGMIKNVDLLGLEQRYERHSPEVYRLFRNLQLYSEEKIDELVRLGFGTKEEIISSNFGPQNPEEKKITLRQKMLKDLTGY